jgi:adenylate kinase
MSTVPAQLPEDVEQYLTEHKVPQLMEHMYRELLLALPEDPLSYLVKVLDSPIAPKIVIAGPPAGGKGTQCELIAKKYGVVHISTGDLLREEVKKGSVLGKQAESYMTSGALVPDALIIALVKDRLAQPDVTQKGWLLDGFPRTRPQALALQLAGIIPVAFIILDVPDAVVKERIEGRRTDPATGKVYHMVYNPPPAGVAVEQRADDTATAIEARLKVFHRNMIDVAECYTSVTVHIDGNRNKDDVFAEIAEQLDCRLQL